MWLREIILSIIAFIAIYNFHCEKAIEKHTIARHTTCFSWLMRLCRHTTGSTHTFAAHDGASYKIVKLLCVLDDGWRYKLKRSHF